MADPYLTNVGLLLHFDGSNGSTTFTDNSQTPVTLTAGSPAALSTAQKKFGTASMAVGGGNASYPDSVATRPGAGPFTIEGFVYHTSLAGYQTLYKKGYPAADGIIVQTNTGDGKWIVYINSGTIVCSESGTTPVINTWYHIAITRDASNIIRIFRDGVVVATSSANATNLSNASTGYIGADTASFPLVGYIDEFRLTKGVARYTANFTPPSAAFPDTGSDLNFANVGLLLHCDGSNGSTSIPDSSSNGLAVTAVGNAQLSTAQKKFGTASILLDGSGDRVTTGDNLATRMGTGDWTVEGWCYYTGETSGSTFQTIVTIGTTGTLVSIRFANSGFSDLLQLIQNSGGGGNVESGSNSKTSMNSTWKYVTLMRSGGTIYMFVGGVVAGSLGTSIDLTNGSITLGANIASQDFTGYLDEWRVTKGIARYSTAGFAPPVAPFDGPDAPTQTAVATGFQAVSFGTVVVTFNQVAIATGFQPTALGAINVKYNRIAVATGAQFGSLGGPRSGNRVYAIGLQFTTFGVPFITENRTAQATGFRSTRFGLPFPPFRTKRLTDTRNRHTHAAGFKSTRFGTPSRH